MERLRYLDFELKIEQEGDHYTVRVLRSPVGEASCTFKLPFSEEGLELLVLKLGRVRSSTRRIRSVEMEAARELGGKLFEAVFGGEVRASLRSSLDEVYYQEGTGLRLKLRLQEVVELADLPWEFLFDPSFDRFLAQSNQTPIVRYIEMPERIRPLAMSLPLRVLVMISSPADYVRLDVERERSMLQKALEPLGKKGKVQVKWLEKATLAALQRCLRDGEYHIFHFIGHGGFDKRAEEGVLVLEDDQGRGWQAGAHRIGMLLHDHRSLRLAMLNSCEGARNSRTDPFAGVATTLIRQGIPAVVAMQFEITDDAAIIFAGEFYTALTEGFPVDAAVAEARKAIYTQPNDVEWGTPVLYMRSPDGVLFSIQEQEREDKKQAEAERLEQERQERKAREKAAREETERQAREKAEKEQAEIKAREEVLRLEAERKTREEAEIESLYKSAKELQDKGRHDEALEAWKKVIELNPKNTEALQRIKQIEEEKRAELEAKKRIFVAGQPRKWPKIAVGAGIVAVIILAAIIYKIFFDIKPPEIYYFKATPETIEKGESSTLSWETSNAKEVEISGTGNVPLSGSEMVSPTETATYTLIARNKEGKTVKREVKIEVKIPVLPPEIVSFSGDSPVNRGESTILRWGTSNAKEVKISSIGKVELSGSRTVSPTETTTYTLIATNEEGKTVKREVKIEVKVPIPPPEILKFGAKPSTIKKGEYSTLSWQASNAKEVTLNGNKVMPSDSVSLRFQETTNYTLIARNEEGKAVEKEVLIKVTATSPEILGFSAKSSTIEKGQSSTLRWQTSNAKEVEISGIGKVELSGSRTVSPTETTTYTLIARNEEGKIVEREVTIGVTTPSAPSVALRPSKPLTPFVSIVLTDDKNSEVEKTVFAPDTEWIYVTLILADIPADTLLKAVWIAEKVEGLPADSRLHEHKGLRVGGHIKYANFSLQYEWLPGSYRVELYLDGRLAHTARFRVVP